jgi:hypothetical protein
MSPSEWTTLERDVVERIRILAALDSPKLPAGQMKDAVLRDLVTPHVKLLKEFVDCVKVGGE